LCLTPLFIFLSSVGELYKLGVLSEGVVHFFTHHLLKLHDDPAGGLRSQVGKGCEMHEEDHEAVVSFKTIGKKIDNNFKLKPHMAFCFKKIQQLSEDTTLDSRLKFAYLDLMNIMCDSGGCCGCSGAAKSSDQLKLRAASVRQEWLHDPNVEELLMSVDEVIKSPDSGKTIVRINIEFAAVDCKASDLWPILDMIAMLYYNNRVSESDITTAIGDVVALVDSFECDNPQIYECLCEMFSAFACFDSLTFEWLCECASRVNNEMCQTKVIDAACSRENYRTDAKANLRSVTYILNGSRTRWTMITRA